MSIVYPLGVNRSIDLNHEIISTCFIQLESSILDDWNDDDVLGAAFPVKRCICIFTAQKL
jgi:hypothetical protein